MNTYRHECKLPKFKVLEDFYVLNISMFLFYFRNEKNCGKEVKKQLLFLSLSD